MKTIIIVGGSRGIGKASIETLLPNNKVINISRNAPQVEHQNLTHYNCDVLSDELPNIEVADGLIYCPGSINLRPFKGLKIESYEQDMQINFFGLVKVIQTILPQLMASEQPSVVLFSSVAASMGMPFHSSIAAAKGAVEGFAKALAAEYASKIRVNVIAPSLTHTPLADKFLNNETKQEKAAERHPMKRFGQPEDLSKMAVFLLNDSSSWMTGQVLHVDGGMSTLLVNG